MKKKAPKLSPAEIDREIKRINRQITQAAKTFGKESRYYQNYEAMLFPRSGTGIGSGNLVRYNKNGIIQISRGKQAVAEIGAVTGYQKALFHLGNVPTVKETKEKMIKSYEERHNVKVKRKEDIARVIIEERNEFNALEKTLSMALGQMYEAEKNGGFRFVNHNEIDDLSKGRYTDKETLERMKELAEDTQKEGAKIVKNSLAGF